MTGRSRVLFDDLIGVSSEPVENLVERGAVRRFAEAIGDPNPYYVDEETASAGVHGRIISPPTFVRTLDYGDIEGLLLPDRGLIHGDHRTTFRRPLYVWDVVMCRREMTGYVEKEARSGLLGFLTMSGYGDSPDGEGIFEMRDTIVITPAVRSIMDAAL